MRVRSPIVLLAALALLAGCSTDREAGELYGPSEGDVLVVDAILWVDSPLPTIFLSRSVDPSVVPDGSEVETGAGVLVTYEGITVGYLESPLFPGQYRPNGFHPVLPETEYELLVITTRGERVTARTTTPPRFDVSSWLLLDESDQSIRRELRTFAELGDSVYAALENQMVYTDGLLEARFDRPEVPAFQVGVFSLDLDSDFVIDPAFFDPEDFEELERQNASPALDGTDGTLRLPWFAIFYEGRHLIRAYALDGNWYDLIRSDPVLSGGGPGFGGNAGDNFQRPIFHVEGGIGLFGSASVDSVGLNILPRVLRTEGDGP